MYNKKMYKIFVIVISVIVIFCTNKIDCFADESNLIYHFESTGRQIVIENSDVDNQEKLKKLMNERYNCDNYDVTDIVEYGVHQKWIVTCEGHDVDSVQGVNVERKEFDPVKVPSATTGSEKYSNVKKVVNNVAGSIILILQIASVAGVILTGITYMYAGADSKSKIKKTLPFLIAGMAIIFAGPTVVKFITDIFSGATGT